MSKYAKWGAGLLALLCAFGLGRGGNAYSETDLALAREEAYNSGYHAGFAQGEASNQEALYTEAFSEGRLKGYDEGLSEGVLRGQQDTMAAVGDTFSQGYETGYAEGYAKKDKDEQTARKQYLSSLPVFVPTDLPAAETGDRTLPTAEPSADEPVGQVVYVTKSGSKYHLGSCAHLSKSKIEKTLSEVKAAGYEPCKTCKPPQ